MRIRRSQTEDAAALARIFHRAVQIGSAPFYDQAQRDDWSRDCPGAEAYAKRLEGLTTFVVEIDGTAQGFLSLRDSDGYIDLMFVAPERIGQGLAFALYRAALEHCHTLGLAQLTVEASTQSHAFFLRQGWYETGTMMRGEGAGLVETRLMALDLIET